MNELFELVRHGMFLCFVAAGIAAGRPAAQSASVVIPPSAVSTDGATAEPFVLGGFEGKTQLIIDRTKLGALAARPIKRLVFRRDAQTNPSFPFGMQGGWIDLTIEASWTNRSAESPAAWFHQNHGQARAPVTVYAGEYRVVDSPRLPDNTTVASFAANVSAHVVLQSPILPAASGNLCIELTYRRHATKPIPRTWLVDLHREPTSTLVRFGQSCYRQNNVDSLAAGLTPDTALGGTLRAMTFGPATPLAILLIGASNMQWGSLRLPFDLTAVGAPGCRLYVSWDLILPTATKQYPVLRDAKARMDLPTPNDAKLAGARIYSQWLFFDPSANALSMTMTNGVSVALAPVPPNLGVGMVQAQSPSATTGRVYVNRAPVIRLEDR